MQLFCFSFRGHPRCAYCLAPAQSPGSLPCQCPLFHQEDMTVLCHAGNMWAYLNTSDLMGNTLSWWEAMAQRRSPVAVAQEPSHLQLITDGMGRQIGAWSYGLRGKTQRHHILLLARDCESGNNCEWPRLESSVVPTAALVLHLERC